MEKILVEHDPSPMKLDVMGVDDWPVWVKEVSTFPWSYDRTETCYLLEGDAIVTPQGGEPVRISAGDLVTFLPGLSCTWDVRSPVKKHYRTG
jgi:uncharacterized cupin superfamily protein